VTLPTWRAIETTADTGFEVRAPGRERLFADAVLAFYDAMVGVPSIRPVRRYVLEASGEDDADLLVNLLSTCLFRMETRGMLLCEAHVQFLEARPKRRAGKTLESAAKQAPNSGRCDFAAPELQGHRLRLSARGERLDPSRHAFDLAVKAVTYHQLFFGQDPDGGWRARVILDI